MFPCISKAVERVMKKNVKQLPSLQHRINSTIIDKCLHNAIKYDEFSFGTDLE